MEIETKVISTEIIKPSLPTPKYLQKHQFSFIDQFVFTDMIPIVYFYSSNPKIPKSKKTTHLKKSLSETLSRFYPLAGRLVDNFYVDCNDGGVPFSEAIASCDLSQVITNPDLNQIKKSLFYKLDGLQFFFLAVQATYFRCGGFAVAILLSHKIGDGCSLDMFANTWSAVARNGGDCGLPFPKFDGATHFPPGDVTSMDSTAEDVCTKTFTFPAATIALLQDRYSAATGGQWRPGRIQTLMAYISTRIVSATGMQADPTKPYFLNHSINLRTRINPPMLKNCFGNISWNATAMLTAGDSGIEVAQILRESKNAILEGYVPQLKDLSKMATALDFESREAERISITSMCGYPLYEVDFGWDKPVWVILPGFPIKNTTILTNTKSGGGIEAVISLCKQDMDKFEVDLQVPIFKSNL